MSRHVYCDVGSRTIIIRGTINARTPELVKSALGRILKNYYEKKKVYLFIKSHGGLFYHAVATHSIIRSYKNAKIYAVAGEFVDSCAFMILQGGDKRFSFPDAKFDIHRTEMMLSGRANAVKLTSYLMECFDKDAVQRQILIERGRPVKKIIKLLNKGATLTARQARKLKLIDRIIAPQRWKT